MEVFSMKKFIIITLTAFVILSLYHCKVTSQEENLTPVLNSISPNAKVSHLPTFTLTATGSNFNPGSIIVFNGVQKQTSYVSPTELTSQVEIDEITLNSSTDYPGNNVSRTSSAEVPVLVRNPSPAGDSNSLNFTIRDNHTFTDPVNITNHSQGYIADFDLAPDGAGNIYVSYLSNHRDGSTYEMFLKRSADNGATWNQASEVPGTSNASLFHDMVLNSSGNINVVWTSSGLPNGIYFSRSNNNGSSWVNAVQVYDSQSFSTRKSCITTNQAGNLYVVFEEYIGDMDSISLQSTSSTDNGSNWSPPMEIYNEDIFNKRYPHRLSPFITRDNDGNIYAFWYSVSISPLKLAIYFSRLDNAGTTWSQPGPILSSLILDSFHIAVDHGGNVNLLWSEAPVGADYQMYFRRFTDKGTVGGQITTLFPGMEIKQPRALAVDSAGNINILFTAKIQGDIYGLLFSRSLDNGASWSQPLEIPYDFAMEAFNMSVDNAGNLYIAIFYYGQDAADIYFSRSN